MNAIQEIEKRLIKYPELKAELEENSISMSPRGGFTVWLTDDGVGIQWAMMGGMKSFRTWKKL